MTEIVTRFAPSPTGYLHIGGARTALFNWLFARANGGRFLLRVEDTDRARSTDEATAAIFAGLEWLGTDWDGEPVHQHARAGRHAEVAAELLKRGAAYKCFATQEEIETYREAARAEGRSTLFRSPWRDAAAADHPDAPHVVRLKAPQSGETTIADAVQGDVSWKNETLDDLVLLRSDGTPTYMLAVVVDDHDMGITHVIRGDDHLTNAARQALIFDAMDWARPVFAHIPLIHGPDGKKMSKRHGATGVEAYRDMGYPAEAMRNYLARLGWSHGDEEFFTTAQAIEWFDLGGIGKSPARFDFKKLTNLSGQHIRAMETEKLLSIYDEFAAAHNVDPVPDAKRPLFENAMDIIKERAKTLHDITEMRYFAVAERPLAHDETALTAINTVSDGILSSLTTRLQHASWTAEDLGKILRDIAEENGVKMGAIAQPVRAALTGRATSPGALNVLEILGREECLARLQDARQLLS